MPTMAIEESRPVEDARMWYMPQLADKQSLCTRKPGSREGRSVLGGPESRKSRRDRGNRTSQEAVSASHKVRFALCLERGGTRLRHSAAPTYPRNGSTKSSSCRPEIHKQGPRITQTLHKQDIFVSPGVEGYDILHNQSG